MNRIFHPWDEAEKKYLAKMYKRGDNLDEISKKLERSKTSVISKINNLKIWRENRPHWTTEDVEFLKANYLTMSYKDIGKQIGNRSPFAIGMKLQFLGLQKREYKDWTKDELEYLKKNYNKIPFSEVTKHLNRSSGSIRTRANLLDITSPRSKTPITS